MAERHHELSEGISLIIRQASACR